jgi:hypothetical protein
MVATATLLPDFRINLFLFGPVKLKWLAVIILVLDVLLLSQNTGGRLCHLGGAMYGFAFIYFRRQGTDLSAPFVGAYDWVVDLFKPTPKRAKMNVHKGGQSSTMTERPTETVGGVSQAEIDRILDKIADQGYDKLSRKEKEILAKASEEGKV